MKLSFLKTIFLNKKLILGKKCKIVGKHSFKNKLTILAEKNSQVKQYNVFYSICIFFYVLLFMLPQG